MVFLQLMMNVWIVHVVVMEVVRWGAEVIHVAVTSDLTGRIVIVS